tara:strand:- start:858 stop:2276 length:1419 start_codon:yes stop_codon:yes gene_type:complete
MKSNHSQLIVIGSGPGGYTAAFRAADLGLNVTLIDKSDSLGGVCLNQGCIPSKSLLHVSNIINSAENSKNLGVEFSKPNININKIQNWKNSIISNLGIGIKKLAKARKINIITGEAKFQSANEIIINDSQNKNIIITFDYCIIATGSSPQIIPNLNKSHPSILDSTAALNIKKIPEKVLIIGGGYIGLELGTVLDSLGSKVTIAEYLPSILSMADDDLVQPLYDTLINKFDNIYTSTEVTSLIPQNDDTVIATFKNNNKEFKDSYNNILISTGRTPNTSNLNINKTGIQLDQKGFIPVNIQRRTLIPNIYAIGDVTGNPMLAHKATFEAKVAAENIVGHNSIYDPVAIPSVIFTHPEIAWTGFTEKELNEKSIEYKKSDFPWSASGRALSVNAHIGKTKMLTNKSKTKILGVGIVGENAGDLISEATLAIEMQASPEDITLTIHPHPTLSETISNSSEILTNTITDLYIPKK